MRPPAAAPPRTASVVVPTYDRVASLQRCLAALHGQRRRPDEVLVAVQRRDTATRRFLATAGVRVVEVDERKQTYAMDAAVRAARGDVVALTDDDAAPRPDWLAGLLAHYDDPHVGGVGGRDVVHEPGVPSDPPRGPVGVVLPFGRVVGEHHRSGTGARPVDFLKGVNLSVRRELWGVDHELAGRGNQPHWELGVCLRIRRLGWRVVFDPAVLVDHYAEPRPDEPQRNVPTDETLWRDAHNEVFELARWLPPRRAIPTVAYQVLVGARINPGPLLALVEAAGGRPRREAMRRSAVGTRARLAAIRQRPWRTRG